MRTGELYINGKDAFITWGVGLEKDSLSTLMTPAPLKQFIENKSRLEHGKRVLVVNARVDERTIQLPLIVKAPSEAVFLSNYAAFITELQTGVITITTSYQLGVKYKMIYESCGQYTQYDRRMAKFLLRLTEPNPADRV